MPLREAPFIMRSWLLDPICFFLLSWLLTSRWNHAAGSCLRLSLGYPVVYRGDASEVDCGNRNCPWSVVAGMEGSTPNNSILVANMTSGFAGTNTTDSEDAAWILTCAFIIFTMQSGFGLVESGMSSRKNETSIMVKNALDAIFGGLGYWAFGFAISVGGEGKNNSFTGANYFLTDPSDDQFGQVFAKYIFELSFATTSATIVSGALAERVSLRAYMMFAFFNTLSYCFPAHWIWTQEGFLNKLGTVDTAGCAAVNLVGGMSALVASSLLKPRIDWKRQSSAMEVGSPTNMLLGMFMLWWGWLGFNCGSTFGISGQKWKFAARAAVTTINAVIGGGLSGISFNLFAPRRYTRCPFNVRHLLFGSIGGLVAITAICAVCRPWEALLIGFIGGGMAIGGNELITKLSIDDPVGCIGVHLFSGVWGMLSVGLFVEKTKLETRSLPGGLFKGGGWYQLGVQILAVCSVLAWSALISGSMYFLIDKTVGFRLSLKNEIRGGDWAEHGIELVDSEDSLSLAESRDQMESRLSNEPAYRRTNFYEHQTVLLHSKTRHVQNSIGDICSQDNQVNEVILAISSDLLRRKFYSTKGGELDEELSTRSRERSITFHSFHDGNWERSRKKRVHTRKSSL